MIDICNKYSSDKIVPAEENGRKFRIKNNKSLNINKVKVDNCYITDGKRCDYLFEIINDNIIEQVFYVELKGSNITHAIEQLEVTMIFCKTIHNKVKNKKCFIVASRYPSAGQSSQILKSKFKRKHNIQLFFDSKIKEVTV